MSHIHSFLFNDLLFWSYFKLGWVPKTELWQIIKEDFYRSGSFPVIKTTMSEQMYKFFEAIIQVGQQVIAGSG